LEKDRNLFENRMIKQKIFLGGTIKTVTISAPMGAGGNILQLLVDCYYQGYFIKNGNIWRWVPQYKATDSLTSHEIDILIDLIRDNLR
jgi:hypothetical protein